MVVGARPAQAEHVDLVAASASHLLYIVIKAEGLGDGDVALTPHLDTIFGLVAERLFQTTNKHGAPAATGAQLVEVDAEPIKRVDEILEPSGEGSPEDRVGVPGNAVHVSDG